MPRPRGRWSSSAASHSSTGDDKGYTEDTVQRGAASIPTVGTGAATRLDRQGDLWTTLAGGLRDDQGARWLSAMVEWDEDEVFEGCEKVPDTMQDEASAVMGMSQFAHGSSGGGLQKEQGDEEPQGAKAENDSEGNSRT